jgi:hypothetical protein
MKLYYTEVQAAKQNGTVPPRVPEYVGECLLLIAQRLANKPNFNGYSYKSEMVSDGIENSLTYINNFDPSKSSNPFAYFTQIIKFSFIRRIEKEKKQHYIKIKNLENFILSDEIDGIKTKKFESNEITDDFVKNFEKNLTNKKKSVKMPLNKFLV